jgi:hypothetical protein
VNKKSFIRHIRTSLQEAGVYMVDIKVIEFIIGNYNYSQAWQLLLLPKKQLGEILAQVFYKELEPYMNKGEDRAVQKSKAKS